MKNKELELEQENTISKYTQENNNILLDLLIKSNKINTTLSLLLDLNNINNIDDAIINPQEYRLIQDNILNIVNILNKNYFKQMEVIKNNDNKQ